MTVQGMDPVTGGGDRWATAVGTGRAFVIGSIGTAVVVAGWAALSGVPGFMDHAGALMMFVVPPVLAGMVGAATARWGDPTIWALIAGALGGWLACAALPQLLTLAGGGIDPNAYTVWLIVAGSGGLLVYIAGFAAGWWISTR